MWIDMIGGQWLREFYRIVCLANFFRAALPTHVKKIEMGILGIFYLIFLEVPVKPGSIMLPITVWDKADALLTELCGLG